MSAATLHGAIAGLETTGTAEPGHLGADGIFLRPGDWAFGSARVRVSTLLGSGVALVLWAPQRRLGAVCHCLHPERPGGVLQATRLDGRYGGDVGLWLERRLDEAGCRWQDLQAMLAGGAQVGAQVGAHGSTAGGTRAGAADAAANIAWAQQWAGRHGVPLVQQDVGGRVLRRLSLNLADGQLTVAHGGHLPVVPQ